MYVFTGVSGEVLRNVIEKESQVQIIQGASKSNNFGRFIKGLGATEGFSLGHEEMLVILCLEFPQTAGWRAGWGWGGPPRQALVTAVVQAKGRVTWVMGRASGHGFQNCLVPSG